MDNSFYSQAQVILGLVSILLELFVGVEAGFDLVLVGVALMIGGFIGIYIASFPLALIVAIFLFGLYFLFGRQALRKRISPVSTKELNIDKLIGQTAQVTHTITPVKAGRVLIEGEEWRAISRTKKAKNASVTITQVSGVTVIVT